jgi:hypothetical protein
MKPQHFALLAVAAALSLVAAIVTYTSSAPWSLIAGTGGKLFPSLAGDAGKVARIEIVQQANVLTVERTGDAWAVKERGGFPASIERVRAFLISLAEADLAEPKTRNPDRYPLLDLEDPKAKSASSRLVRLLDDTGAVVAEAVVGKQRPDAFGSGKAGTYVRRPGEAQTWLVDTDIAGGLALRDWIKSVAFETSVEKISRLKIELPGEPAYEIERSAAGEHKLTEIPAGKKLKFVNALDNMVEAVALVEFEDVRKQEAGAAGEAGIVSLETEGGLKALFKIRRDKDDAWLSVSVTGEGEAKKAADEITARSVGWEFKILPSKADALLKKRDELLEDSSS